VRGICTVLLARNSTTDRLKAVGYVEQAVAVIEENTVEDDQGDETYPLDERQWLLAMAYNTGIEALHASVLDEAKRWLEVASVICRFIPGSQARSDKISEIYSHILSRYTTD